MPTSSNGEGDCTGLVPDLVPEVVAADNCGIAAVSPSPAAGTSFRRGARRQDIRDDCRTDIYGNVETCKVSFTLLTTKPDDRLLRHPDALDNTPQYCHYFVAA
ncbi:MAG: hypothetical protein KIS77_00420 [Saprospiraceae bacterium]|nr:hypothetical protein [Saprospiraceae bacterium]